MLVIRIGYQLSVKRHGVHTLGMPYTYMWSDNMEEDDLLNPDCS